MREHARSRIVSVLVAPNPIRIRARVAVRGIVVLQVRVVLKRAAAIGRPEAADIPMRRDALRTAIRTVGGFEVVAVNPRPHLDCRDVS